MRPAGRPGARAIVELAGRDDAQTETLMGEGAHEYGRKAAEAIAGSDGTWHVLTTSVAY